MMARKTQGHPEAVRIKALSGTLAVCTPHDVSAGSGEATLDGKALRLRLLLRGKSLAGGALALYDHSVAEHDSRFATESVVAFVMPWPFGIPIYFGDVVVRAVTNAGEPRALSVQDFLGMLEGGEEQFTIARVGVRGFDVQDAQRIFRDCRRYGTSESSDGDLGGADADEDLDSDGAEADNSEEEADDDEEEEEDEDGGGGPEDDDEEDYGDDERGDDGEEDALDEADGREDGGAADE